MAKVGETDPRWIVENRTDGANVNNWHWTEKNLISWTKNYFEDNLVGLTLYDGAGSLIKTEKIDKVEGEVVANNRKGKTIFFYELNVKIKWIANSTSSDGTAEETTGFIELPYISEENDDDEHEIKVTVKDSGSHHDKIKQIVHKEGRKVVTEAVVKFLETIRTEFSANRNGGQYQPKSIDTLEKETEKRKEQEKLKEAEKTKQQEPKKVTKKSAKPSSGISTKDYNTTVNFSAPTGVIYECFIDPGRLNAITQGSSTMEPAVGGKFSMYGGIIQGENLSLDPGMKIEQKWRFKEWKEGHYSNVKIELTPSGSGCKLTLTHTGIPSDDLDRTVSGWKVRIFENIKMMFGFGSAPSF